MVERSVPLTYKLFSIVDVPVPPIYILPDTENCSAGVLVPTPTAPKNVEVAVVDVAVKYVETVSPTTESVA